MYKLTNAINSVIQKCIKYGYGQEYVGENLLIDGEYEELDGNSCCEAITIYFCDSSGDIKLKYQIKESSRCII